MIAIANVNKPLIIPVARGRKLKVYTSNLCNKFINSGKKKIIPTLFYIDKCIFGRFYASILGKVLSNINSMDLKKKSNPFKAWGFNPLRYCLMGFSEVFKCCIDTIKFPNLWTVK